jgi:citrate lyase subunit beta/citryl-CoA lyase
MRVILDFEDSVPPAEKAATRAPVAQALAQPRACRGYVRGQCDGNSVLLRRSRRHDRQGSRWRRAAESRERADLHAIDWLMRTWNASADCRWVRSDLIPIIETSIGLSRIERTLQARTLKPYSGVWRVRASHSARPTSARMSWPFAGPMKRSSNTRAPRGAAPRARAGLEGPLDSPWFHLKDTEGFRDAIARSRRAGYQGRLCIHPDQISVANEGYAPTAEEIAAAGADRDRVPRRRGRRRGCNPGRTGRWSTTRSCSAPSAC